MDELDVEILLERLHELRAEKHTVEAEIHTVQTMCLGLMKDEDPSNEGVPVLIGGVLMEAFRVEPGPGSWFDMSKLMPWLVRKKLWREVSIRVLDQDKLAAAVRAGYISDHELDRFQESGTPPSPHIRFRTRKIRRFRVRRMP